MNPVGGAGRRSTLGLSCLRALVNVERETPGDLGDLLPYRMDDVGRTPAGDDTVDEASDGRHLRGAESAGRRRRRSETDPARLKQAAAVERHRIFIHSETRRIERFLRMPACDPVCREIDENEVGVGSTS